MKNLVNFIKEAYDKKEVNNLKVIFDILPEDFYLTAPETYSESDIQIYLGDVLLKELPAENKKSENLLGKNKDNINDAYFEYEKFEHIQDYDSDVNLEWDSYYDDKVKEEKLNVFKLTNLKYIILFDLFEILDNTDNTEKIIDKIFHKLDSSLINKYPVKIKYKESEFEE